MVWEDGLFILLRAHNVGLVSDLVEEIHAELYDELFRRIAHLGIVR